MDYLDQRADFFDWDDFFPEGTMDVTMYNEGQTPLTVQFYRTLHYYLNADEALLHLILAFLCWEVH